MVGIIHVSCRLLPFKLFGKQTYSHQNRNLSCIIGIKRAACQVNVCLHTGIARSFSRSGIPHGEAEKDHVQTRAPRQARRQPRPAARKPSKSCLAGHSAVRVDFFFGMAIMIGASVKRQFSLHAAFIDLSQAIPFAPSASLPAGAISALLCFNNEQAFATKARPNGKQFFGNEKSENEN